MRTHHPPSFARSRATLPTWSIPAAGVGVGLLLLLIVLRGCTVGSADCSWGTIVGGWVDENQNGMRDPGELPLEGLRVTVNDTVNHYQDVAGRAVTDWNGTTRISVWLPGCPDARFEVTADPPTGYQPTTAQVIAIQGDGYGDTTPLQFGFARLPGVAAPTPYVAGLTCATEAQRTYDFAMAADGTLWSATDDGAMAYNSDTRIRQTYPISATYWSDFTQIQIASDQTVWISDLSKGAARLHQGIWSTYLDQETLVGSSEPSIGTSRDGRIWFATHSPGSNLVAFDPVSGGWSALISSADYHVEQVRIFNDGGAWRASFGSAASYDPPYPLPPDWTFIARHTFDANELHILPDTIRGIHTVTLDTQDRIWVVHNAGVSHFDIATSAWTSYTQNAPERLREESMYDITVGADGAIWVVGGDNHALAFRFNPQTEQWRSYDPRDGLPNTDKITHVAVDSAGQVWFGFGYNALLTHCNIKP